MGQGAARGLLGEHLLLNGAATNVRVRVRQRIAVSVDHAETVFIVRSGLLALNVQIEGRGRKLLQLLYPGEVFLSSCAPPLPEVSLVGLAASEAWRMSWAMLEGLMGQDASLARAYMQQAARQSAYMSLHAAAISALTGEERVATFLLEQVMRLGRKTTGGIAFELPMSREDIADYLALNADTLSRIMSRMRASGVVTIAGRGHALMRDVAQLRALSPIADAVTETFRTAGR